MKNFLITFIVVGLMLGCASKPVKPPPEYLINQTDKSASVTETAFIVNAYRYPVDPKVYEENLKKSAEKPSLFGIQFRTLTDEEKNSPQKMDAALKAIAPFVEEDKKADFYTVGSYRQESYSPNYLEVKPGIYRVHVSCNLGDSFARINVTVIAVAGKTTFVQCEKPQMIAKTVVASAFEIKDTDKNFRNLKFVK